MMVEVKILRKGKPAMSVRGDVSENGDLCRLKDVLKSEFRVIFPNESMWDDDYDFSVCSVPTESAES